MWARHRGESFLEHLASAGVSQAVLDTGGKGFLPTWGALGRVEAAPGQVAACPRALCDKVQHGHRGTGCPSSPL